MIRNAYNIRKNPVNEIKKGFEKTSKILSFTIGPRGKNILIWDKITSPQIINDGISIVSRFKNSNFVEFIGQSIIKEIIRNTNNTLGDGTSTTGIILAKSLRKSLDYINIGYKSELLSLGILNASLLIMAKLNKISWPLIKKKDIYKIAINSTGGDQQLGKILYTAFNKVGVDGMINIETKQKKLSDLIVYGGLQIDRGYLSSKFINNQKKATCEFHNCAVLVSNIPLTTLEDAICILKCALNIKNPLLLITEKIEKIPLITIINNSLAKKIQICAIKVPSFGKFRKSIFQDISIATGSQFLTIDSGNSYNNLTTEMLGSVRKCIVTENNCTLITKNKFKKNIFKRVKFLEKMLENTNTTFESTLISERIAKLSGGIAVIRIGGSSEVEIFDKKLRIEDAKNTIFSALTQGVLTGSSVVNVHFSNLMKNYFFTVKHIEEKLGINILFESLITPNMSIIANSGYDYYVFEQNIKSMPVEIGFDSEYQCLANLVSEGVIDPSFLLYNSLMNLNKITPVLLSTNAILAKIKIDSKKKIKNKKNFTTIPNLKTM